MSIENGKSMVRLKDIAERASVSVMTVSKVMRDAPDVSAATKARIRRLADEMGYMPDSMAQSLRTRTTKMLGVIVSGVTHPVFGPVVTTMEERAHDLGYDVVLTQSMNAPEREELCVRRLLARRVDGLFIAPVYRFAPSAPAYLEIARRGVPMVVLGHKAPFCAAFANVETDDSAGSYAAAKHLLGLGHRRIAFFAGPAVAPWAQERLEGYRRALREANLEVDDRLIYAAGSAAEHGETAALQMLNEGTRPTAIQAATDSVAIGAANVLLKQGLRIPSDISIAGFGNIALAENFRVPLTTVRQPKAEIGACAIELMAKLLHGPNGGAPKRIPTDLMIRESTGAAQG